MFKLLGVCLLAVVLCGLPSLTLGEDNDMKDQECNKLTTCDDCISGRTDKTVDLDCYWCSAFTGNKCRHFDFSVAFPVSGIDCPQLKYNVGTCKLTALIIIILIGVGCLLFVVTVIVTCCLCCCWCNRRKKRVERIQEALYEEERDGIRQRAAERRAERRSKHDDIRRKYGLHQDKEDPSGSYKRF